VVGGKAIVRRFVIRQLDLDKRSDVRLPGGELILWRQFER
jgi:hypothetical protein